LDLAQTSKRKPVLVVLLLPIVVLVAMDLVASEFVPVYYHNAFLIVVLVLMVVARDMVGVFGCRRVCYVVVACFCVVKIPRKAKMRKKGFVEATAFMY
jgi:hypothetical protein